MGEHSLQIEASTSTQRTACTHKERAIAREGMQSGSQAGSSICRPDSEGGMAGDMSGHAFVQGAAGAHVEGAGLRHHADEPGQAAQLQPPAPSPPAAAPPPPPSWRAVPAAGPCALHSLK